MAAVVLALVARIGIILVLFETVVLVLLTATFLSCIRDDPVRDTPEVSAFIANRTASEHGLVTFDALYGLIDDLLASSASRSRDVPAAQDLRAAVEDGSWPHAERGTEAHDPLLWVRLAEDYLEERTGEIWEVVDFSYPFGSGPAMARRGGSSHTTTCLACASGPDRGLYVDVRYYRWDSPTRYTDNLDDARARRERRENYREFLAQLDALEGRTYLCEDENLFVWSTGPMTRCKISTPSLPSPMR